MKIKNGCAGCPECKPEEYGKSSVASSGYAIPVDAEENLLLDTLARIRIATGLIKPMLTELPGEVRQLMDELRNLRTVAGKCEELRNMLEDVVNELDLSDGMIEQHGPMGTAPAKLVRLVLARKDQEISMLKSGMKCLGA